MAILLNLENMRIQMISIEDFTFFNAGALPTFVKYAEDNVEAIDHAIKSMNYEHARDIAIATADTMTRLLGITDYPEESQNDRMDKIADQLCRYAEKACSYQPCAESTDLLDRLATAVDSIYAHVYR